MPDIGSVHSAAAHPYGLFSYQVIWSDGTRLSFQEVSGLDANTPATSYRDSNRPDDSTIKRPSFRKPGAITLKRGVFARQCALPDWMKPGKVKPILRAAVTIELVDATGTPRKRWRLKNAFPVKVVGPTLDAKGNDVAIESIELSHEGLSFDDN